MLKSNLIQILSLFLWFSIVFSLSKHSQIQMSLMKGQPKKVTTVNGLQQFIVKDGLKPVVLQDLDSKKTDADPSFNVLFERGSCYQYPLFPTKEQQYKEAEVLNSMDLNIIKHSLLMELTSSSLSGVDKRSMIRDSVITNVLPKLSLSESKLEETNWRSGGLLTDWNSEF